MRNLCRNFALGNFKQYKKAMDVKVGDKVRIRCFDGSVIEITVTSTDGSMVYGTSGFGSHWADIRDIVED